MNPTNPTPAIVQPAILQKLAECRALSAGIRTRNRQTAADIIRLGKLLTEMKAEVGHGRWQEFLEAHWPDIDPRTDRFWRNRFKTATAAQIADAMDETTHAGIDDADEGCGEDEDNRPQPDEYAITANAGQNDSPATAEPTPGRPTRYSPEQRRMIDLIGVVNPTLRVNLLAGRKKLTDAQLREKVKWACDQCRRIGPPHGPSCETCKKNRADRQRELFEQNQEPAVEGDPAASPAPPLDPLAEARQMVTKLTTIFTRLLTDEAEECVRLRECLVECRLVYWDDGKPRFRGLAGVSKVLDILIADPDADPKEVAHAYGIASGGFVPPVHERLRKGKR